MKRTLKFASVFGTAVLSAATLAYAASPTAVPQKQGAIAKTLPFPMKVACAVSGSPSEFPDDIRIYNAGVATVPAGTKVNWSVPFAHKQGSYTLTAALQANKATQVSGVLPGGVEAGKPCSASIGN